MKILIKNHEDIHTNYFLNNITKLTVELFYPLSYFNDPHIKLLFKVVIHGFKKQKARHTEECSFRNIDPAHMYNINLSLNIFLIIIFKWLSKEKWLNLQN